MYVTLFDNYPSLFLFFFLRCYSSMWRKRSVARMSSRCEVEDGLQLCRVPECTLANMSRSPRRRPLTAKGVDALLASYPEIFSWLLMVVLLTRTRLLVVLPVEPDLTWISVICLDPHSHSAQGILLCHPTGLLCSNTLPSSVKSPG